MFLSARWELANWAQLRVYFSHAPDRLLCMFHLVEATSKDKYRSNSSAHWEYLRRVKSLKRYRVLRRNRNCHSERSEESLIVSSAALKLIITECFASLNMTGWRCNALALQRITFDPLALS